MSAGRLGRVPPVAGKVGARHCAAAPRKFRSCHLQSTEGLGLNHKLLEDDRQSNTRSHASPPSPPRHWQVGALRVDWIQNACNLSRMNGHTDLANQLAPRLIWGPSFAKLKLSGARVRARG